MDGIRNCSLFLALMLLDRVFATVPATRNQDSARCKVYYRDNETVTCVHGDEFDPSLASYVMQTDCDIAGLNVSDEWPDLYRVTTLRSIDCMLNPDLFGFLLPLPFVRRFDSKQNSAYLTSEPLDYDVVLGDDIFRRLCALEFIDLSYSGLGTVESLPFHCTHFLGYLNLSNNGLVSLPAQVFRDLRVLKGLLLGDNDLNELKPGLLDDLTSLVLLDLHSNNISHLPDEIFRHQTNLQRLLLSDNRLTELREDVFANLKKLERLELANNRLTNLGGAVFHLNTGLRYLDLSWNQGLSLSNEIFRGLEALEILNLEGCDMQDLPEDVFLDPVNLTYVYLNGNWLRQVDSGTFATLQYLTELVLSDNLIGGPLGKGLFENLGELDVLVLRNNGISQLSADSLRGLISLQTLDLSKNAIELIVGSSLDPLTNLKKLDLSDNLLSSLTFTKSGHLLSGLAELEHLYLANNTLGRITNAFMDNGKLLSLVLSQNVGLELDKKSFAGLYGMRHLHLESCEIHSLPDGIFSSLFRLQTLHLRNNFIKEIRYGTFAHLSNLRSLYLDFNNVNALVDRPFKRLGNLRHLRMSNNQLSRINTEDLDGLSSLSLLDVSCNSIEVISGRGFHALRQLEILNVSRNTLRAVEGPRPFQKNRLSTVDASHNLLKDISNMNWWNMEDLRGLLLNDNRIEEVHLPQYVASAPSIHLQSNNISSIKVVPDVIGDRKYYLHLLSKLKIYLAGNPLPVCDCRAYDLYTYAKEHEGNVMFVDGLQCQSPQHRRGREMTTFEAEDFVCAINKSCPRNCTCTHTPVDRKWNVNCTGSGYVSLPDQVPPGTNVLLMDFNNLTSLVSLSDVQWGNLTELHLENNLIAGDIFTLPTGLKLLGLRGNRLTALPSALLLHSRVVGDFKVTLSNNPWPCDCAILPLLFWLTRHKSQVSDLDDIRCTFANGTLGPLVPGIQSCGEFERPSNDETPNSTAIYASCIAAAIILLTAAYFYNRCRKMTSENSTSASSSTISTILSVLIPQS